MNKALKRLTQTDRFIDFVHRFTIAYLWTVRLRIENEAAWQRHLEDGGSVLLCGWHQQFFSAIRHFRSYRVYHPSIMISRSSDGQIVAGVAERVGWHTVRGSSSSGGLEALKTMIRELNRSRLAAHILDGPRGPAGIVKAGAINLAQMTGAVIVPVTVFPENAWFFNSWDRFFVPKPFSRVTLRFGEAIPIPRRMDAAQFEAERRRLEAIMRPALLR